MVWFCRLRRLGSPHGKGQDPGGEQARQGTATGAEAAEPDSWLFSREGTGCPHLLLQVVHHGNQQPHLTALLRVSDEEVHIMALQLPPEGGQSDS